MVVPVAVRSRRGRLVVGAAMVLVAVFAALSATLFVWPQRDRPAKADAIIVLGGHGNRPATGVALARAGFAPVLVFSVGSTAVPAAAPPGVELVDFRPDPLSTQGEARAIARLAADRGWRRIIVVPGTAQATRARIRIRRCYRGGLLVVPPAFSFHHLAYDVVYEWGALAKALVLQRAC